MKTVTVYTEGRSVGNPGQADISIEIREGGSEVVRTIKQSIGNATSNFAAYQAVITALVTLEDIYRDVASDIKFEIQLDNSLVYRQLSHLEPVSEPGLVPLFITVHNLRVVSFPHLTFILQTNTEPGSKSKPLTASKVKK